MKGPNLSGNISGTDPLKDNRLLLLAEPLDDTDEAKHTAAVVNELSKEISRILVSHPVNAKRVAQGKNIANVVLLRGCGIRIEVCFTLLRVLKRSVHMCDNVPLRGKFFLISLVTGTYFVFPWMYLLGKLLFLLGHLIPTVFLDD